MIIPTLNSVTEVKTSRQTIMKKVTELICVVMLLIANGNGNPASRTNVVSVPSDEDMGKATLEEVDTYAELKEDPSSALPPAFTICSTIMAESRPSSIWLTFFTILDNDRAQIMAPVSNPGSLERLFIIIFVQGTSKQVLAQIPPMFPNRWTRSCLALNTTSGMINWVVEGTLVLTTISEEVKNLTSQPKDLSNKIVLSAKSYGGNWFSASQKVTNMNIFESALSIEKMKSVTGGENCLEEGDYLAWADMEWILHGEARIETIDKEEPCRKEPLVNLYYTQFSGMDACMHHCQNLGSRVPSVTDFQDWTALQNHLKLELYDKGLNNLRLWLPVEDRKIEGEWRDFYTGRSIQNFTPPWVGSKPDGGNAQNCAFLLDGKTWGDYECDSPYYACMCTHKPSSYLKFKGLCPNSAIDVYYKPTSDVTDSRKLELQGLERTSITYDIDEQIWILDVKYSNVTGISRATHASFTLGKHNWTIKGDKGCNADESHVTELKMSGCQTGNFTCGPIKILAAV